MLRSLIRQLIKEAILTANKQIILSKIDLDNVLIKNNLFSNNIKDLQVYCAYTHIGKWYQDHLNDETMKIVIKDAVASPFQVADVIKKDIKLDSGYTLTMSIADRESWYGQIAYKINDKFKTKNIKAVTCADSTSDMPEKIAKRVAEKLGVPFVKVFQKNKDAEQITLNIKRFNKWYESPVQVKDKNGKRVFDKRGNPVLRHRTDNERHLYLTQLITNLVTLRNGLRDGKNVSIARNIKNSRREFFNGIHNINNNINGIKGNLLIIDDNIDSGATFIDINKQLEEYKDITPMYAVGFRMNRKTTSKKENISDDDDDDDVDDGVDISDEKNVIPYSVKIPQNYEVGNLIQADQIGVGKIINVDSINKKIKVNFNGKIKILKYNPTSDLNTNKKEETINEIIRLILLK